MRYKYRGSSGKVNLALDGLPELACKPGRGEWLRGAISFSPSLDYMERAYDDAKYGRVLEAPVHRLHHPDARRPDDGASGQAHDELLRAVRAVPPGRRQRVDARAARRVRRDRDRHARGAVPRHPQQDRGQARALAQGHRGLDGPVGGEHLPGRALAGAAVLQPAGARLGALPHAGARPVDVRVGHAPRRRHHGRATAAWPRSSTSRRRRRDGGRPDGEVRDRRHRRGPQRPRRRRLPREGRAQGHGARALVGGRRDPAEHRDRARLHRARDRPHGRPPARRRGRGT